MPRTPPAGDLALLARMLSDGSLRTHVDVEVPLTEAAQAIQRLIERNLAGKAVIYFAGGEDDIIYRQSNSTGRKAVSSTQETRIGGESRCGMEETANTLDVARLT